MGRDARKNRKHEVIGRKSKASNEGLGAVNRADNVFHIVGPMENTPNCWTADIASETTVRDHRESVGISEPGHHITGGVTLCWLAVIVVSAGQRRLNAHRCDT